MLDLGKSVPATELRRRLAAAGHIVQTTRRSPNVQILPVADRIITIALRPDPVVEAPYRQNYFVMPNAEDCAQVKEQGSGRLFAHWESEASIERAFIEGPIAWVRERLTFQPYALIWAHEKIGALEGTMRQQTLLRHSRPLSNKQTVGHALLGLYEMMIESQCLALDPLSTTTGEYVAWLGRVAYRENANFYVATDDLAEVFLIHHHAKVQIMVPEPTRRAAVLEKIQSAYFDISGYEDDFDEPTDADSIG